MKKITFPILALLLITGISCQETIDIEKEKEAIIAVIEKETNAAHRMGGGSWASLVEDWESCFVQDESYVRFRAGKNSYGVIRGWDEFIDPEYIDSLRNVTETPVPGFSRIEFENYQIKVYPESAWAIYDEVHYRDEWELPRTIPSVRFLEKVDGEWKMVLQSWINAHSYEVTEEEVSETEE